MDLLLVWSDQSEMITTDQTRNVFDDNRWNADVVRCFRIFCDQHVAALKANRWEIKSAAAALGISRPSLYVLMDKLPGIRKAADLDLGEIQAAADACEGNLDAMAAHLEVSKRGLMQRMKQLGMP